MVNIVENGIGDIFETVVKNYGMNSGDIAPDQDNELDRIKDDLYFLLTSFVNQNKYSTHKGG